jgi:general secretion pathway protein F
VPRFSYNGVSTAGRRVSGAIDAESVRSARARLREQGILASDFSEGDSKTSWSPSMAGLFRRRVSSHELARTMRQLATLLGAGIPLADAVLSLRNQQTGPALRSTLQSVHSHIVEGGSLEEAMGKFPQVFPSMYSGLVRAGEATGSLDAVLVRIAEHAEASTRLQAKLRAATTYPLIMAAVGGLIVVFLLAYVVPQVTRVFAESDQALPLPTRLLIGLADIASAYYAYIIVLLLAAIVAMRYYSRLHQGRRRLESIVLRIPYIGRLLSDIWMARFAQTMSSMLVGGLPVVEALQVSRGVVGSALVADEIERAGQGVTQGESLADALRYSPVFSPMVIDMIDVGERSSELHSMLGRAAAILDEDVQDRFETMATLLEPATIIIMAAIVLFIVLAVLLPVFELNQLVR